MDEFVRDQHNRLEFLGSLRNQDQAQVEQYSAYALRNVAYRVDERYPISVKPPPLSRWTRFRMWLAGVIWPAGGH